MRLVGGGSKGAAHIGVLKALEEENIEIEYLSGTSSGSIIASLYAMGYTTDELEEAFNKYCSKIVDCDISLPIKLIGTVLTGKLSVKGIAKGNQLEGFIRLYCSKKNIGDISQIKLPLAIPTVDVKTGEIIYYTSRKIPENTTRTLYDDSPTQLQMGDIASIVRASCSLPGVYIPKVLHERNLVDGGIRMNTPVSVLRKMGAQKILAISFDQNKNCQKSTDNIISIAMQSFDIMAHQVNESELASADVVIRPRLNNVSLLGCDKIPESIAEGYRVTKSQIDTLRKILV